MKKHLSTMLLTAVGMTLSAAAAYAQTDLNANVPFEFRTTNTSLSAGKYAITTGTRGNAEVIQIRDLSSRHTIFVLANQQVKVAPGNPRLVFRCGEASGCVLIEAYTGSGNGWVMSPPRGTHGEKERVAVVLLHRADAD